MDNYLIIVRDQNDGFVGLAEVSGECLSIERTAREIKGYVDFTRQLEGKSITECVEVWVRETPRDMHLLCTFFCSQ